MTDIGELQALLETMNVEEKMDAISLGWQVLADFEREVGLEPGEIRRAVDPLAE